MFLKSFRFVLPRLINLENILPRAIPGNHFFPATCTFRRMQHTASQDVLVDITEAEKLSSKLIVDKVNNHIAEGPGRLFAIIQIAGKQYKVTENDLVLIERNWAPDQGDKLIFEKVLLVGGSSFTLVGRPILPSNVVKVVGTIAHKDLTHTKLRYRMVPKKNIRKLNFVREELTYIRINSVEVYPEINNPNTTQYMRC